MQKMSTPQQRLEEIAKQELALADEKAKLLAASKDADLETVKKLCKQHGFTATQLRGSLKAKGSKKPAAGAAKKPAAKKAPAAKKSKAK
jgi:predicted LPLAT superfamily acyltransferase